jgi:predicted RNase H-like HicB family nuclease
MKYAYPAILYPDSGQVGVKVPDLPGCFTFGADNADALLMAKDAVEMWLWDAENKHEQIPAASASLSVEPGEIFTMIAADTDEYRKANETRAIINSMAY